MIPGGKKGRGRAAPQRQASPLRLARCSPPPPPWRGAAVPFLPPFGGPGCGVLSRGGRGASAAAGPRNSALRRLGWVRASRDRQGRAGGPRTVPPAGVAAAASSQQEQPGARGAFRGGEDRPRQPRRRAFAASQPGRSARAVLLEYALLHYFPQPEPSRPGLFESKRRRVQWAEGFVSGCTKIHTRWLLTALCACVCGHTTHTCVPYTCSKRGLRETQRPSKLMLISDTEADPRSYLVEWKSNLIYLCCSPRTSAQPRIANAQLLSFSFRIGTRAHLYTGFYLHKVNEIHQRSQAYKNTGACPRSLLRL